MAAVNSIMMPLDTIAPDFTLRDVVSAKLIHLKEAKSPIANVVLFICNHCPYVVHIQERLVILSHDHQKQGVQFFAICSNDATKYPDDAPDKMKVTAQQLGYPFPYLHDETQSVARAYNAQCTPDIFVFDGELKCRYRGQFDDSRPSNGRPVTGADLSAALDAMITHQTVSDQQKPSMGCSIKWR